MGDWSSGTYIASQIVIIFAFALLGATYFTKKRNWILCLVLVSCVLQMLSFGLLTAWVGVAMCGVAIGRNIIFLLVDKFKREEDRKKIITVDWIVLVFLIIVMVTATYFAQDGWLTWFGFLGTLAYVFAVWQKNVFTYRILGLISEVLWIVYNIVIGSLFGIILESVLTTVVLVGLILYIIEIIKKRSQQNAVPDSVEKVS